MNAEVKLISYYERCLQLLKGFRDFRLEHISRLHNEEANRLAQHASGYQPIQEVLTSFGIESLIDWHALDIDSGISPLCLQIHINTSLQTVDPKS